MDFFRPGLPRRVLRRVRSTNTISSRLLEQLQELNDHANAVLSKWTPQAPPQGSDGAEAVFADFYSDLHISDPKLGLVPEVPLAKLKEYLRRLTPDEFSTQNVLKFAQLVSKYTVVIALHHLANSIVYKTIVVKSELSYWSDMKTSTYAKVIYGIQTAPQRGYSALCDVIANTVVSTSEHATWAEKATCFVDACRDFVARSFSGLSLDFLAAQSRFGVFRVPMRVLDDEIRAKIDAASAELAAQYVLLGKILHNVPANDDSLQNILPGRPVRLLTQLDAIDDVISACQRKSSTAPPSFVTRTWPILLLLLNYGPSATSSVVQNRYEIAQWLKTNLVDTVTGFWTNWIIKPIGDMLSILRNDEALTITLKESLQSDLDSLERMVKDYIQDNTALTVSPTEIHKAVQLGDMTMVMSEYEKELKSPYWSILTGLMVRSILIQVQKTKVDGDLAISGIDKMLKLQQLLLGVLSILPSLFIVYQANKALRKDASLSQTFADRRLDCLRSLNAINKLVDESGLDAFERDGRLFVEIVLLNLTLDNVLPKRLRDEFLHDLNILAMAKSGGRDASVVMLRIWNMYSGFFRK